MYITHVMMKCFFILLNYELSIKTSFYKIFDHVFIFFHNKTEDKIFPNFQIQIPYVRTY